MSTSKSRPNVLFFIMDDQRFDTIRALGNPRILTPTLDRFVREGTAFTHTCIMGGSCSAVCMPSRAMLLTGRTLFHIERQGQDIAREHLLLGEHLQRAGYVTFGTGKWHNGSPSYARSFTSGAEIFFGGMEDHWNVPACDFDPSGRYEPKPVVRDPWVSNQLFYRQYDHIKAGKHSSELFCDAAIDFIEHYDSPAPFFMYVAFMAPHDPRTMPKEYLDLYEPTFMDLPPNVLPEHPFDNGDMMVRDELLTSRPRNPREVRRHLAEYFAMITHADAQIGRVVAALEAKGLAENTIIVFTADHGLALGQHGLMGKQNLYDHSVRVPLLMVGPGIPRGEQRDSLCYLHDVYPTLCDLLGLPIPPTVEGKSLVPALRDPACQARDVLLAAYAGVQRSARDRRFKLIEYVVQGRRTTQLFDLQADPWEVNNLADDPAYAEPLARLRAELVRWRDELDDTQPGLGEAFWAGYQQTA